MKVLSLFNGMSTLQTALENQGFEIEKYYSSEIKKYAISFVQEKYPNTIQLGDVTKWKEWDIDWSEIDFIGSGSPCQDLSIAGKRKGLKGERSSLFWTFIDILNHVKELNPNVLFLQENVGSAPKDDVRIMSEALGVIPVRINSNLVTAQNRDRYYWTNIRTREDWTGIVWTDIPQPKDRGIMLKDIICSGNVEKEKSNCLLERHGKSFASYKNPLSDNAQKFYKGREDFGTLTCVRENTYLRLFNQIELERLQGFPDGWTSSLSYNHASSLLGDGWTLPVIEHILSFINLKNQ